MVTAAPSGMRPPTEYVAAVIQVAPDVLAAWICRLPWPKLARDGGGPGRRALRQPDDDMAGGRLGYRLRGHSHGDRDGLVVGGEAGTRGGDGGGVGPLPHGGGGRQVDPIKVREAEAAAAVEREREPRAAVVGLDAGAKLAVGGEAQIAGGTGSDVDIQAGGYAAADLYRDGDGLRRIDGVGVAHRDDAGDGSGRQGGGVQGELERDAEAGLRRAGTLRAHRARDPRSGRTRIRGFQVA